MNNANKIDIIICGNNKLYLDEQKRYIENLIIPDEMQLDVLVVEGAKSMTSGYNEGMANSDAKYKIYMHQDTFIVNRNIISDLLDIFQNPQIGMIGMVGTPKLPENAIMWNDFRYGKLYTSMNYQAGESIIGDMENYYEEVEAIDGFFMATQYDIPWREDIFDKWDFYDISQSFEFEKMGYKVVVPNMDRPWCIHDDGFFNLKNYYRQRKKFLEEYKWKMRVYQ